MNTPEASLTAGRPLGSGDIGAFEAWASTYQSLREKTGAEGQLIDLGRTLYRWLDGNERWLDALLPAADPPLIFEFQALATTGAAAKAFLQAPWELLAEPDGGFLADDAIPLLPAARARPRRATGAAGRPVPRSRLHGRGAAHRPARPRLREGGDGDPRAAGSLGLDLLVEESGNLDLLA